MFSRKILSISWLLSKTVKCFLMMVLMLRNNGFYCVTKLHEVEKLLLLLGFLTCSLEIFLALEDCFLLY